MIDGTGMTEDVGSGQMMMSREWVFYLDVTAGYFCEILLIE
jgi:hypothetical protein